MMIPKYGPTLSEVFDLSDVKDTTKLTDQQMLHNFDNQKTHTDFSLASAGLLLRRKMEVLKQIAAGMFGLHHRGLAHNDLHAENIMFRASGGISATRFQRSISHGEIVVIDYGKVGEAAVARVKATNRHKRV